MTTLAAFIAFDHALRDCVSPMQLRAIESQLSVLGAACARADREDGKRDAIIADMRKLLARMAGHAMAHEPAPVVPLHAVPTFPPPADPVLDRNGHGPGGGCGRHGFGVGGGGAVAEGAE